MIHKNQIVTDSYKYLKKEDAETVGWILKKLRKTKMRVYEQAVARLYRSYKYIIEEYKKAKKANNKEALKKYDSFEKVTNLVYEQDKKYSKEPDFSFFDGDTNYNENYSETGVLKDIRQESFVAYYTIGMLIMKKVGGVSFPWIDKIPIIDAMDRKFFT